MRALPLLLAIAVAGCSSILGLEPPRIGSGSGSGHPDGGMENHDFSIDVTTAAPRVPAGSFDFLDITIARVNGFAGDVTVDLATPPAGVTTTPLTIAADATTGKLQVTGASTLTVGTTLDLDVTGTSGKLVHDEVVHAVITIVPGTLDPTFGSGGLAQLTLQPHGNDFFDVSVGSDGSITAVGTSINELTARATAAHFSSAGVLDTTVFGGGISIAPSSGSAPSSFSTLARHESGRILAGGQGHGTNPAEQDPWIAGFDTTGALGGGYNGSGNEVFDIDHPDSEVRGMATITGDLVVALMVSPDTGNQNFLYRSLANGGFDFGFTGSGVFDLTMVGASTHAALAIDKADPNQPIYVVGSTTDNTSIKLVRVTEAAAFDPTFGTAGVALVTKTASDNPAAVATESDGVLVAGNAVLAGVQSVFVERFHKDGTVDTAFGTGGRANPMATQGLDHVIDMIVQTDGKILVAADATGANPAVMRFNPDGSLDTSYGTSGTGVISLFVGSEGRINAIELAADGSAIIAGGNGDTPGASFLARLGF